MAYASEASHHLDGESPASQLDLLGQPVRIALGQPSKNSKKKLKNLRVRGRVVSAQVRQWTFDHPPSHWWRGWPAEQ